MTTTACPFVWYELMTTDDQAAEAFYSQVIGWKTADAGMPGMRYTLLSAGDAVIAGLMTLPTEEESRSSCSTASAFTSIDSVDAPIFSSTLRVSLAATSRSRSRTTYF